MREGGSRREHPQAVHGHQVLQRDQIIVSKSGVTLHLVFVIVLLFVLAFVFLSKEGEQEVRIRRGIYSLFVRRATFLAEARLSASHFR